MSIKNLLFTISFLCIFGLGSSSVAAQNQTHPDMLATRQQQQERTCYQLTKLTTCVDDPSVYGCSLETTYQAQADGSFLFFPKKPRFPNLNAKIQVWTAQGKARITSATGTGDSTWIIPPTTWCSDQDFTSTVAVTASGECSITEKYWNFPVDTVTFEPNPAGHPFGYITATGPNENKSATQNGIRPVPGTKEPWTLGVQVSATCNNERQGDWAGETFIAYEYTALPAGQEPPPGTGSSVIPPSGNGQPGSGQPADPGTGNSGGATNTLLPLPPFGTRDPFPGAPGLTLQAGQRRANSGALVYVPVWLINAKNNVANMNFEMTYDPAVAIPEGDILAGNMLAGVLFSANRKQPGTILFGFASVSDLSGTGTVAYVPFRLVGPAGSRTPLNLQVTTINNTSGSIPAIDRIPGEIVVLQNGQETGGDCNGDGYLSSVDALCALQISVQLRPVMMTLDIDKNGSITSRDATMILQEALRR